MNEEGAREVDRFAGPDEALEANPLVSSKAYPSGEWASGLSQDSHGLWRSGGGTVVVKDSRGGVHAYFGGHVCGPGFLGDYLLAETKSLDEFYEKLRAYEFVVHKLGRSRTVTKPSVVIDPKGMPR